MKLERLSEQIRTKQNLCNTILKVHIISSTLALKVLKYVFIHHLIHLLQQRLCTVKMRVMLFESI